MAENPFARTKPAATVEPVSKASEVEDVRPPLITEPGAYPGIDGDLYHHSEICDSPSISSTGLKLIESKSPAHYWWQSPLNPNRPIPEQKPHFSLGKALHDVVLLGPEFIRAYFILPEGFDARLKKWQDVKEERDEAIRSGIPVLTHKQHSDVQGMAEQLSKHELARALIVSGIPEMTLAAKDPETGVWMRTKPDITPDTLDIVPDLKTTISAHPSDFESQATRLGYFQSAAHYIDVIDQVYGAPAQKRRFVLIAVEKEAPFAVQIYQLDDEGIQMGRMLNRKALNQFAACLKSGIWPGYSTDDHPILQLQPTRWFQSEINRRVDAGELSWES